MLQLLEQCEQKISIVGAEIAHLTAHSAEGLVEAEVVVGMVFGGFTLCPIPVGLLKIDDEHEMVINARAIL